jgi:short-subunit dehydrogenase
MNHTANLPRPVTLVTGASAGIGAALARVFAQNGHQLVLVARREGRLTELATEIAETGAPRPIVLPIDLNRSNACELIATELTARGLEPQYVVNNAGIGLFGEAARLDRAEQLSIIDLNVRCLTDLSLAFVDSLSRHRGGILNVASVGSFLPGPGMAVYYATKAYVLSFSEALSHELVRRGVRVSVLCPGPVPTEFQGRAGVPRTSFPMRTRLPRVIRSSLLALSAREVAEIGYAGLMCGRRVVVPGRLCRIVAFLPRLLPRRVLLEVVAHSQLPRRRSSGRMAKQALAGKA